MTQRELRLAACFNLLFAGMLHAQKGKGGGGAPADTPVTVVLPTSAAGLCRPRPAGSPATRATSTRRTGTTA
jgi:hypothetical protein